MGDYHKFESFFFPIWDKSHDVHFGIQDMLKIWGLYQNYKQSGHGVSLDGASFSLVPMCDLSSLGDV